MDSIKQIYKTGHGPSSSHTMGPAKAAHVFKENNPSAAAFRVTLYGSLAATGKGHLTDVAILHGLQPLHAEIAWCPEINLPAHPNGMKFEALDEGGLVMQEWTTYSIGGGDISDSGKREGGNVVYDMSTMTEILEYCKKNGIHFWEYVAERESADIWDYLSEVWKSMQAAIHRGLEAEGVIQGGLKLPRKASSFYTRAQNFRSPHNRRMLAFAYAVSW
jgi:L-serine dehydratase